MDEYEDNIKLDDPNNWKWFIKSFPKTFFILYYYFSLIKVLKNWLIKNNDFIFLYIYMFNKY
jgi:hypothetical protein